ncbi:hypothetical protein VP01_359g2 [Puccinia sorghi]|uniref:Uncharacterized protein n=1 Tax=Puccinia sorghi TaxID=27349 RepID=A0A0L6UX18_9BASI|nr:hypothetical protein VP01_359g2 [Puccinia sorghi]
MEPSIRECPLIFLWFENALKSRTPARKSNIEAICNIVIMDFFVRFPNHHHGNECCLILLTEENVAQYHHLNICQLGEEGGWKTWRNYLEPVKLCNALVDIELNFSFSRASGRSSISTACMDTEVLLDVDLEGVGSLGHCGVPFALQYQKHIPQRKVSCSVQMGKDYIITVGILLTGPNIQHVFFIQLCAKLWTHKLVIISYHTASSTPLNELIGTLQTFLNFFLSYQKYFSPSACLLHKNLKITRGGRYYTGTLYYYKRSKFIMYYNIQWTSVGGAEGGDSRGNRTRREEGIMGGEAQTPKSCMEDCLAVACRASHPSLHYGWNFWWQCRGFIAILAVTCRASQLLLHCAWNIWWKCRDRMVIYVGTCRVTWPLLHCAWNFWWQNVDRKAIYASGCRVFIALIQLRMEESIFWLGQYGNRSPEAV